MFNSHFWWLSLLVALSLYCVWLYKLYIYIHIYIYICPYPIEYPMVSQISGQIPQPTCRKAGGVPERDLRARRVRRSPRGFCSN